MYPSRHSFTVAQAWSPVLPVLVAAALITQEDFRHWFLVPVTLCALLVMPEAMSVMVGRLSVFEPRGYIGLFGLHFFFLAPILHVYWDQWLSYLVDQPGDWRAWLGVMAALNAAGLVLYRVASKWNVFSQRPVRTLWAIAPGSFWPLLSLALATTAALQISIYARFGGVTGYVETYESGLQQFDGYGWLFMLSESFPILAFIGFAVYVQGRRRPPGAFLLAAALLGFIVLKLYFGGLRGSRSNTVGGIYWAAGIVHFTIRPLRRRTIAVGACLVLCFMYCYGFYKSHGLAGLQNATHGAEARSAMTQRSGRTLPALVLNDLGRSATQAYIVYRCLKNDSDYQYAWGRTYLGAAALLIPRAIWPDRPPTKVKEGTNLRLGPESYSSDTGGGSSWVYGLAGEACLNFTPWCVPLSFIALGVCVAYVSSLAGSLPIGDSRRYLLPLLVSISTGMLTGDSDNLVFGFVKNGLVPVLLVAVASRRLRTGFAGVHRFRSSISR